MREHSNFSALTIDFSEEGQLEEMIQRSNLRHDFFIFAILKKGSGRIKINLKEFKLGKNSLLILPPDATKEIIFISDDAILKVLAYTSTFLTRLQLPENFWEMTDYFSTRNSPVWALKKKDAQLLDRLINAMQKHLQAIENHVFGPEILNHLFMVFILQLGGMAKKYSQTTILGYSRKENLTIDFYALAKKHFRKQRQLAFYADRLFVSPKYLTETVKAISGKNAGEILDNYAVQEARILLQTTDQSISEIADSLFFADQSSFGKFFKRMEGTSPTNFRNIKRI